MRLAGYIGMLILLTVFLASCQDNRTESVARVFALCGQSNEKDIRVYLVSVSDTKSVTLSQTIDLPMTASCPTWIADSNVGWLYGRYTDVYQRGLEESMTHYA
jgi:hypothetical protein